MRGGLANGIALGLGDVAVFAGGDAAPQAAGAELVLPARVGRPKIVKFDRVCHGHPRCLIAAHDHRTRRRGESMAWRTIRSV